MTDQEIYEKLCNKDPRNPMHKDIYGEWDEVPPPRSDCSCDNCFTGRDKLAVELLATRAAYNALSLAYTEDMKVYL